MVSSELLINSTIQAVILSVISNVLAQFITAYQTGSPFHLDLAPIGRFSVFSILSCPPNVLWQSYLESKFPAYPAAAASSKKLPPGQDAALNKTNTLIKVALDQTIGAVGNTVAFIAGMALLRGELDPAALWGQVRVETWPLMRAGQKLWPAFSVVSFALVPLQYRTLAGGIVGTGWGVYLSLIEGRSGAVKAE